EKDSADNTIIIKSISSQSLGISRQLNFDSKISLSDLTSTPTADLVDVNVADAGAVVNLSAKVASGIVGLDNDDLKITFSGNAFEQERAVDAEDPKDRDRIDLDITLSNFGDLETFTRMNASSFIGLLRQVGNWLDQARQSDLFASIDIPFTGELLTGSIRKITCPGIGSPALSVWNVLSVNLRAVPYPFISTMTSPGTSVSSTEPEPPV
ncbi:unnamed protein product, partial [marine sediment metagenome]